MLPFFTVSIVFILVGAYALAAAISGRPLPLRGVAFLLALAALGLAALTLFR
jgi:hypothetical protein